MKKVYIFFMLFLVSSCSLGNKEEIQREMYANEENVITLQNPKTKVMIRCYANEYQPADVCAKIYEQVGYVRTKDIPVTPAKYDLEKPKTYPTRRWREGESSSRW